MHLKDKIPVMNVKNCGVKGGWEEIQKFKAPCVACYTICNNDFNFIANLKLSTLITTFLDFK